MRHFQDPRPGTKPAQILTLCSLTPSFSAAEEGWESGNNIADTLRPGQARPRGLCSTPRRGEGGAGAARGLLAAGSVRGWDPQVQPPTPHAPGTLVTPRGLSLHKEEPDEKAGMRHTPCSGLRSTRVTEGQADGAGARGSGPRSPSSSHRAAFLVSSSPASRRSSTHVPGCVLRVGLGARMPATAGRVAGTACHLVCDSMLSLPLLPSDPVAGIQALWFCHRAMAW